uniref:Uncharacterized protein n=1 Tax=Arundo donax TaxID=35708 RepID=A0A0A8ZXE1_ARUDO
MNWSSGSITTTWSVGHFIMHYQPCFSLYSLNHVFETFATASKLVCTLLHSLVCPWGSHCRKSEMYDIVN